MQDVKMFLIKIWKKALKIRRIDSNVSLFELGADSISVAKCVRDINEKYSLDIEIPIVFEYDTIDLLAEYISTLI